MLQLIERGVQGAQPLDLNLRDMDVFSPASTIEMRHQHWKILRFLHHPVDHGFSALTQHNYKLTHSVDGIPLLTHIRPKNALRSETEGLFLLLKKHQAKVVFPGLTET